MGKKIKQKVVRAITTSHSLGFRVAGFKVWRTDKGTYDERDKKYGISLTAKTMIDAIRAYLTPSDAVGVRYDVAVALLAKLKRIREWMQTQTQFSFNSSSILLLYDQESQTWDLRLIVSQLRHSCLDPEATNRPHIHTRISRIAMCCRAPITNCASSRATQPRRQQLRSYRRAVNQG